MPALAAEPKLGFRDDELLDSYNAQAALVHSLQASAIVRAKAGPEFGAKAHESQPSPVLLSFRMPASLRVTGVVPFSTKRTFDLASDGREFRLLVPDGKLMHFFVGPVDAPATSTIPRENLRPQPIVEALSWIPARLAHSMGTSATKGRESRTLDVELNTPTPGIRKAAQIEFDLKSGTVSRLTILDAAGKIETEVQYSEWQRAPVSGEGNRSICFPRQISVTPHQQDLWLGMKIVSVQIDAPVPPSQLRLLPPRGVVVTRLPAPHVETNQ